MIVSFRNKGLEELYWTGKTRRIGATSVRKCLRILQILDIAVNPENLDIAGLHFHPLKGKPPRWSVRVTGNYRVTFGWLGEDAVVIDYEDYH